MSLRQKEYKLNNIVAGKYWSDDVKEAVLKFENFLNEKLEYYDKYENWDKKINFSDLEDIKEKYREIFGDFKK